MFYPTVVIAIGDLAHRALQETNELLQAFRSPARYITALGVYDEGNYLELSAPALADSAPFESTLMRWLYTTRAEVNIDRAREAEVVVGPPAGYLLEQVLLVVDSNAYDHAQEVVASLQSICERADELIPTRLHWVVLHPSYDEPLPPAILIDHQERLRMASPFQEGKLHVMRLVRSDGSNMTPEQLRETVAYLLLGALHSAQFDGEHWLYRSIVDPESAPSTLGCGLVTLPLHRVMRALEDKLIADALSAFLQSAQAPLHLPPLDENSLWRTVIDKAASAWSMGETERIKVNDKYAVSAQLSPPRIALRNPDRAQLEAISEWEQQWQNEKLPRWRNLMNQFANAEVDAYLQSLQEAIHAYLRAPKPDLNTVVRQLQQIINGISEWGIHHLTITHPTPSRKESLSKRVEKSIQEPPPRIILGIKRPGRPQVSPEVASDLTNALQEYYEQMIIAEAQAAFQSAVRRLQDALRHTWQSYTAAQQRIMHDIREHHERALHFRCERLPWLEPLVYRWEHLEPIADTLWGERDLASLVGQYIDPEQELRSQLPRIAQNLRQYLQRWMTDYYRRFSYYLNTRFPSHFQREQWCQQRVKEMRAQAERTLWHTEKGLPQMWQITPPNIREALAPHAPDRLWECDAMLGFIAAARGAEV
ncbi:MAG: hypothetical protein KatS3mg019_0933 [Fimbriimonadales bacterium]|nr:MAG: hypothetical protein KatS3mg019_0933 [Fimbriimonadales bacterium]